MFIPTLYILSGVSGVGKSTYAKRNYDDCVIVSRDAIRFSLLEDGDDYFKYESIVQDRFYGDIAKAIDDGHDVVADATHINSKSVNKTIRNVKRRTKADFDTCIIYFDSSLAWCHTNNEKRIGRAYVPPRVIADMHKHHQPIEAMLAETGVTNHSYIYMPGSENEQAI